MSSKRRREESALADWLAEDVWNRYQAGERDTSILAEALEADPILFKYHHLMDKAVYGEDVDAIQFLVENGMPVNWPDAMGNCLHEFAALTEPTEGACRTVAFLLEMGIDTEANLDLGVADLGQED